MCGGICLLPPILITTGSQDKIKELTFRRNFAARRLGVSSCHFPAKSPPGGSGDEADGSRWSR